MKTDDCFLWMPYARSRAYGIHKKTKVSKNDESSLDLCPLTTAVNTCLNSNNVKSEKESEKNMKR